MKVKIKVLHTAFYPDMADKYLQEGKSVGACPLLKCGDEFEFVSDATMPEGFCPWAWCDISSTVRAIAAGASFESWNKNRGETIVCCQDGIRPVSFLITRIEE